MPLECVHEAIHAQPMDLYDPTPKRHSWDRLGNRDSPKAICNGHISVSKLHPIKGVGALPLS